MLLVGCADYAVGEEWGHTEFTTAAAHGSREFGAFARFDGGDGAVRENRLPFKNVLSWSAHCRPHLLSIVSHIRSHAVLGRQERIPSLQEIAADPDRTCCPSAPSHITTTLTNLTAPTQP